jgi:Zn-dependent protease with chaperone function
VLAVVLVAWQLKSVAIFRWLVRTKPVDDPVLVARFADLVAKAGMAAPLFEQVDLPGSVLANAVALPARPRPAVVMTGAVARFEPDEVVAICAHELAHLEYYNPRRVRGMNAVNLALVAGAVSIAPLMRHVDPGGVPMAPVIWMLILVATLVVRARNRQKHETASDLRAIALTGDPEALVRALTRIHAIARLPRRWDAQFERQATHPSLARRIQAIRAAAGAPPAALGAAATFTKAGSALRVTLHDDRVEWHDEAVSHAVRYTALTELRIDAARAGAAQLVVVEKSGQRWTLPFDAADVARAQATLDIVDTRLGGAGEAPALSRSVARIVAIIAAVMAAGAGQYAVVISMILAVMQPSLPLVAGAGAATLAAAAVTWRDQWVRPAESEWWWSGVALLCCGALLLGIARTNRGDMGGRSAKRLVGALAACAALAWTAALSDVSDAIRLHQSAREWPSATILAMGAGAALACFRPRVARYVAASLFAASAVLGAAGTNTFLDRFGDDAFLADAPTAVVRTVSARALVEFEVPATVDVVRVSPSGRFVALGFEDDDENRSFHIGAAGGPMQQMAADEVLFIDDERLLLMNHDAETSILRVLSLTPSSKVVWEQATPRLYAPHLSADAATHRWQIVGSTPDSTVVRVEGVIGSTAAEERRWPSPAGRRGWVAAIDASGDEAFAVETNYDRGLLSRAGLWRWVTLFGLPTPESRLWVLGADGATSLEMSRMDPRCGGALRDRRPVCAAFDGGRTRFFAVDLAARRLVPVTSLPGRVLSVASSGSGWMSGWYHDGPIALQLETGDAVRVATREGGRTVRLAASDRAICAVEWNGGRSIARILPLESPAVDVNRGGKTARPIAGTRFP